MFPNLNLQINSIESCLKQSKDQILESEFKSLKHKIFGSGRISRIDLSQLFNHFEQELTQKKDESRQKVKVSNQVMPESKTERNFEEISKPKPIIEKEPPLVDSNKTYKLLNQMYRLGKHSEILTEFQNLFAQNGTITNTKPIPKLMLSILTKSIIKTVIFDLKRISHTVLTRIVVIVFFIHVLHL